MRNLICLIRDHRVRHEVPEVFHTIVWCGRCGKRITELDSPYVRKAWQEDEEFRFQAMCGERRADRALRQLAADRSEGVPRKTPGKQPQGSQPEQGTDGDTSGELDHHKEDRHI
jgi:hypothetical protein